MVPGFILIVNLKVVIAANAIGTLEESAREKRTGHGVAAAVAPIGHRRPPIVRAADRRDAVRQEHRVVRAPIVVHVEEPGDGEAPAGIQDDRSLRDLAVAFRPDPPNASLIDEQSGLGTEAAGGEIEHPHTSH